MHDEKQEMDKVIKEEIPKQARITVLYDRLKADEEYLSTSYSRYMQSKKEYEALQQQIDIEIPKKILDEIEQQILPDYLIRAQKQRYMSMLTVISYTTAFLSIIPIFNMISRFFVLATIYPLIHIIKLNMPKDINKRKRFIRNLVYYGSMVVSFLMAMCCGYLTLFERWYIDIYTEILFYISALLFIVLLIAKLVYFIIKKKIKNKNELL